MKNQTITVTELLSFLPQELLERVGEETGVDYQVKKLKGEVMLKLLLFGLTTRKELSWRIIENIFHHYKFRQFAGIEAYVSTDHSSLATRLSNIQLSYFEQIHKAVSEELVRRYPVEKIGGYKIVRFDSTLVSIASTLLKMSGLQHGVKKSKRKENTSVDIKFSVGFNGLGAPKAKLFNEQTYLSEDIALKEVISEFQFGKDEIAVFDRGLNSRKALEEFSGSNLIFVTRLRCPKGVVKHEVIKPITSIAPNQALETESLLIEQDQEVFLYRNNAKTKHTYRLIKAISKKTGEILYFLTNEKKLSVEEILLIYAHRWDIEVFFKFLKQEFGFKHLLSRNRNGIEVMLYMTLIAFELTFLYYKLNKISGFKIAKIEFANELEFDILKIIVELCKGDPNLLYLLNPF